VAWYRSRLKRGRIAVAPPGDARKEQGPGASQRDENSLGTRDNLTEVNTHSLVRMANDLSLKSSFYEQVVEHVFIAEVLQEALFGFGQTVEVLRSEVDSSGYDLVFECNGILRYVQLKTSKHDAKRQSVNVNIALAKKPGGCVVWLVRDHDPATRRIKLAYLFFGGGTDQMLPDLDGFRMGKHAKGDSTGKKNVRPSIRLVPKKRFTKLTTTQALVEKLFGLCEVGAALHR
jgi:hypothetical protein